ncbi:MAG: WecB/TagA/CpsF family glycosyltransferase [Patescibacteria group bacterium]
MQQTHFHGHTIAIGTRADYLRALEQALGSTACTQVVTLNPEYVVIAAREPRLQAITQPPNVVIPDGIGLVWALKKRGLNVERYPGAEMVTDICAIAAARHQVVGILVLKNGLSSASEISAVLQQRFPQLEVCVVTDQQNNIVEVLAERKVQVLFVTLGQPQQDLWVAQHARSVPSLRLALGVGGAFDFLTGKRKRAPRLMQRLGLEWLWRLITQPRRLPRMLRATFGFWHVIRTTP